MISKLLLLAGVVAAAIFVLRLRNAMSARAAGRAGSTGAPMGRREAAAVLGIAEDASEATIIAAHRRLIGANHPDRGGSDYLAQQVNEARGVLLRHHRGR